MVFAVVWCFSSSSTWNRCWDSPAVMTLCNTDTSPSPSRTRWLRAGMRPLVSVPSQFFFRLDFSLNFCFHSSVFLLTNAITWPELKRTIDAVCVQYFFESSTVCFFNECQSIYAEVLLLLSDTCSPSVWTLMFVLAVARITRFNFAMILNQMFQVPRRKTWTLDERKCELFKSFFLFFRLRQYQSGVCVSFLYDVLLLSIFLCVTDAFPSADWSILWMNVRWANVLLHEIFF